MARQIKYTFLRDNTAAGARLSILLSVVSMALMGLLFILAFFGVGQGKHVLGAVGLVAALLAVYAFILGITALARRGSRIRTAAVAATLGGIALIGWVSVFIFGTV